ncbi:hypothetical protein SAMN05216516_10843 [Izhakiella capsodis]|uniref:Uncharacterized protein n=1 Tax=Izhakiella capsodis TaxID=1367852 RepID=A0A1I4Z902_9GAMM|nr:hypothetical protein SAMN05216516_10843 [Izhakiella capsodis]
MTMSNITLMIDGQLLTVESESDLTGVPMPLIVTVSKVGRPDDTPVDPAVVFLPYLNWNFALHAPVYRRKTKPGPCYCRRFT